MKQKLIDLLQPFWTICVTVGMTLIVFIEVRADAIILFVIGLVLMFTDAWITHIKNKKYNTIYFAKTKPDTIMPSKESYNAGYDIYANFDDPYMLIHPHETLMIPTKLTSAFSEKYYMQLFERGSTGTKGIGQRCGVIDSSFRGEWFIPITNHNKYPIIIAKMGITEQDIYGSIAPKHVIYPYEKALAQAVLLPVPQVVVKEVTHTTLLDIESDRGISCLGGSGK